jgi:hypothetical protein
MAIFTLGNACTVLNPMYVEQNKLYLFEGETKQVLSIVSVASCKSTPCSLPPSHILFLTQTLPTEVLFYGAAVFFSFFSAQVIRTPELIRETMRGGGNYGP